MSWEIKACDHQLIVYCREINWIVNHQREWGMKDINGSKKNFLKISGLIGPFSFSLMNKISLCQLKWTWLISLSDSPLPVMFAVFQAWTAECSTLLLKNWHASSLWSAQRRLNWGTARDWRTYCKLTPKINRPEAQGDTLKRNLWPISSFPLGFYL